MTQFNNFRSYIFLNGEETIRGADFITRNYGESSYGPHVQAMQVHGISSTSIKVSWRLALPHTGKQYHSQRLPDSDDVDGFYILYRSTVGRPPGQKFVLFWSICFLQTLLLLLLTTLFWTYSRNILQFSLIVRLTRVQSEFSSIFF